MIRRPPRSTRTVTPFPFPTLFRSGPVPLQSAIDGALLLIGDRLRAQGIALEVGVEEPTIAVHADRVRLEQVLINLLQNAAEALRGTDGARVTLLAHGDGPVLIDVCDNGPRSEGSPVGKDGVSK